MFCDHAKQPSRGSGNFNLTKLKLSVTTNYFFFRIFCYFSFFIIADILDFFLEAVFFFNNPVLTDLSKIFWTCGKNSRASFIFFSEISFLTCFMALRTSSFFLELKLVFLFELRRAFLADCVIGMRRYYMNIENKSTPQQVFN